MALRLPSTGLKIASPWPKDCLNMALRLHWTGLKIASHWPKACLHMALKLGLEISWQTSFSICTAPMRDLLSRCPCFQTALSILSKTILRTPMQSFAQGIAWPCLAPFTKISWQRSFSIGPKPCLNMALRLPSTGLKTASHWPKDCLTLASRLS